MLPRDMESSVTSRIMSFVDYVKCPVVLLIGLLTGCLLAGCQTDSSSVPPENRAVFNALTRATAVVILQKEVHCEVAGPGKSVNGATVYPETRVSDFLAAYLVWSQQRTKHSVTVLECEGGALRHCVWRFGESKTAESWTSILRFDYDVSSHAIVPQSLGCSSVP